MPGMTYRFRAFFFDFVLVLGSAKGRVGAQDSEADVEPFLFGERKACARHRASAIVRAGVPGELDEFVDSLEFGLERPKGSLAEPDVGLGIVPFGEARFFCSRS